MHQYCLIAVVSIVVLAGCAALDPNPNIGMRTTDLIYSSGDCEGARKAAEPAALRGEPWAQLRMGAFVIDKNCPAPRTEELPKAIEWLRKAACFESKSAWERGNEFVVGPSGYFNARASSTKAAALLSNVFLNLQKPSMSWYYLDRARSQYSSNEAIYNELTRQLAYVESVIGEEQLSEIKKEKPNLCLAGQPSAQHGGQPDAAQ